MTETVLSEKLGELIKGIHIDARILEWVKKALQFSQEEEKKYNKGMLDTLGRELAKIQGRLAKIYEDKLDRVISNDLWEELRAKYTDEQERIQNASERKPELL